MTHNNQSDISKALKMTSLKRIKAEELFDKKTELIIEHNGEEYHLRRTSNNKLILTK